MEGEKKIEYVQTHTPDIMRLGELVIAAKGPNRTMAQFAKECNVGPSTLSRIANGKIRNPLTEDVIRAIYEHRDKDSKISLNEFMRANGFRPKIDQDQRNGINGSYESRREEAFNRERKMKNAIVEALIDRNIPIINGMGSTRGGKIESPYGMTAFFDYSFYIEDEKPQIWCFQGFKAKFEREMDFIFYKRRMDELASKVFLIDAWSPEILENIKYSFVFCEPRLYEFMLEKYKGAPIKSAMSAILIDVDNETIVEEKWISSTKEIPSVLSREVETIPYISDLDTIEIRPEDIIEMHNSYWRKLDE